MRAALLLLALLLCSGCAATGGRAGFFTNPVAWFTQRGERAEAKAKARAQTAETALLAIAQRNVEEFMAAIRLAPPSRPVEVAKEAGAQAAANLAQLRGPLTAARLAEIEARATALVSEDPATRAPAERARTTERQADAATAEEVATLRQDLAAANTRADAIAAQNATLAAKYLYATIAAAASTLGVFALSAIAWGLRTNFLGLQGAASALQGASLQASGTDLVIAATGVHITLYGAAAKSAGQLYQADALRNGELVAVATRTFAAGALNPLARIDVAAP
jgi:hypothetical protein